MQSDDKRLNDLRVLILKSQREVLDENEVSQLNDWMRTKEGAVESAALIDQLCAFSDSKSIDSPAIANLLVEACRPGVPGDVCRLDSAASAGSRSKSSVTCSLVATPTSSGLSCGIPSSAIPPEVSAAKSVKSPTADCVGGKGPASPRSAANLASDAHRFSNSSKRRWWMVYGLVGLAASHLLIASLTWSLAKPGPGVSVAESTGPPPISPQFVSMTACVWRSTGDFRPSVGEPIQHGEVLDLVEGIAELRLGKGTPGEAIVRIEGPASVFVRSDGGLGVRHGILTVKSLGTGSGNVIVDGPLGEVSIDGQSSVGLISKGNVNEFHVFSGRASIQPALVRSEAGSTVGSTVSSLRLSDGEAVRFSPHSSGDFAVVMFDASLSSFVSARSSGFDPLNLGAEYERTILESNPSIYWRFENLIGEPPFRIVNRGSVPGVDLEVIGEPGWREYKGNHVTELGRLGTSSGFCSTGLWPNEPLENYTVELWVKPELYHHGEILCMHEQVQAEDGRFSHTMMLETLATLPPYWSTNFKDVRDNSLRFVHRTPASNNPFEGSNMVAGEPYEVRVWQHLAAIKQGDRMSLWLDGKLASEQSDPTVLSRNMQFVIGQLYASRPERRFVGQIDEIAVYDRCLTPDELFQRMKAAGRAGEEWTSADSIEGSAPSRERVLKAPAANEPQTNPPTVVGQPA